MNLAREKKCAQQSFTLKANERKFQHIFVLPTSSSALLCCACISSKLFHVFSAKHFLIRKQFRALLECLKFTKQLRAHFLWVNGCDAISKLWRECGIKFQNVNCFALICRVPSSTQNTRAKFWHSKARFWVFETQNILSHITGKSAHMRCLCSVSGAAVRASSAHDFIRIHKQKKKICKKWRRIRETKQIREQSRESMICSLQKNKTTRTSRWWWWRRWRGNGEQQQQPTEMALERVRHEIEMRVLCCNRRTRNKQQQRTSLASAPMMAVVIAARWKYRKAIYSSENENRKKNFSSPCKSLFVSPCFAAHFAISKAWTSSHKYELKRKTQAEALLCVSRHDSASGREGMRSERRKKREKNFMNFNEQELCRVEPLNSHRRRRRQRQNGDEKIFFFIIFLYSFSLQWHQKSFSSWMNTIKRLNWKFCDERCLIFPIPASRTMASRASRVALADVDERRTLVAENLIIFGWVDLAWFIEKFFINNCFFSVIFISRRFHVWLFAAPSSHASSAHRRAIVVSTRDHHYVWTQFTGIMHTRCENKCRISPIPTDSELNTVNVQRVHVWTPLIITQAEKRN